MDARAQHRLYVLNHVLTGGLTAEEAALVLELSIRQVRRLLRRYRADGSAGLVHGNRARVPGHRIPDALRDRVVELATTTYAGVTTPGRPRPAGQLRARRLSRPTEDRPELDLGLLAPARPPAPPAEQRASRPAADHPWRRR